VTNVGKITDPLVPSTTSKKFPFYDVLSGFYYTENGTCSFGSCHNAVVSLYYDPTPTEKPHEIDTVTISLEKYDRFVAIEKALKEIYTEAKKNL